MKPLWSLEVSTVNEIITLDHAANDQVNLKDVIIKFKNPQNQKFMKKIMKKNLLLKMRRSLLQKENGLLMLLRVDYFRWDIWISLMMIWWWSLHIWWWVVSWRCTNTKISNNSISNIRPAIWKICSSKRNQNFASETHAAEIVDTTCTDTRR